MRKLVARIKLNNLINTETGYFDQPYANRVQMPVFKFPRGIPEDGETCAVLITQEDRWFYNRFHALTQAGIEIDDPRKLLEPETKEGKRIVIRIYRLDPPAETPAKFELVCYASYGKNTRMKHAPHEEPPPGEEIAGGTNTSNGTHWCRIAVLLRTSSEPTAADKTKMDEELLNAAT